MKAYKQAFREYGLPRRIRTDNGYPFNMVTLGGLTPLTVWLIKLGIKPERIAPGLRSRMGGTNACNRPQGSNSHTDQGQSVCTAARH